MRKVLVFQHVAYEPLGTLNPLLKKKGFRIRYVNFGRQPDATPRLDGYEGLIILGGPMSVDQTRKFPHLTYEMRLIEDALKKEMPVMGICLGAQLLARALGATVTKNPEKEIGWYEVAPTKEGLLDPLIGNFQKTELIFQWHGDTFTIPSGAQHLATGKYCPRQAFRYGKKAYAFQFHMEVDEGLIKRWLHLPHYRKELEEAKARFNPDQIIDDTTRFIKPLKHLSERTFGEFIKLFGRKEKLRALPSR